MTLRPAVQHPGVAKKIEHKRKQVVESVRPHESQHARPPCPSQTLISFGIFSSNCLEPWFLVLCAWLWVLSLSGDFPLFCPILKTSSPILSKMATLAQSKQSFEDFIGLVRWNIRKFTLICMVPWVKYGKENECVHSWAGHRITFRKVLFPEIYYHIHWY